MSMRTVIVLHLLLLPLSVASVAAQEPCAEGSDRLHFLLGEWSVTRDETVMATSRVSPVLENCAIEESMEFSNGALALTLTMWVPGRNQWVHVRMDPVEGSFYHFRAGRGEEFPTNFRGASNYIGDQISYQFTLSREEDTVLQIWDEEIIATGQFHPFWSFVYRR